MTQHAILVNIARADKIGRSALAERLGMDRTTLTRDLKPLENAGLVDAAESDDRRERLLALSQEGLRRLKKSYDCWEKMQKEFAAAIGDQGLATLRSALATVESAAENIAK